MTYIEFKKLLLDIEMTLPEFCSLIKVSDKNIRSYKKKSDIPNAIAVVATCFAELHRHDVDFRVPIEQLKLRKKTKTGGFGKRMQSGSGT